jgi:hypothetical protein
VRAHATPLRCGGRCVAAGERGGRRCAGRGHHLKMRAARARSAAALVRKSCTTKHAKGRRGVHVRGCEMRAHRASFIVCAVQKGTTPRPAAALTPSPLSPFSLRRWGGASLRSSSHGCQGACRRALPLAAKQAGTLGRRRRSCPGAAAAPARAAAHAPRRCRLPLPQAKKSKAGEGINARLQLVMKSGKYTLGYKTVLKCLRSGKGARRRGSGQLLRRHATCATARLLASAAPESPGEVLGLGGRRAALPAQPAWRAACRPPGAHAHVRPQPSW